jgi:hypothetical protein
MVPAPARAYQYEGNGAWPGNAGGAWRFRNIQWRTQPTYLQELYTPQLPAQHTQCDHQHTPIAPTDPRERQELMRVAGGILLRMEQPMSSDEVVQSIGVIESLMSRAAYLQDGASVRAQRAFGESLCSTLRQLHKMLLDLQCSGTS